MSKVQEQEKSILEKNEAIDTLNCELENTKEQLKTASDEAKRLIKSKEFVTGKSLLLSNELDEEIIKLLYESKCTLKDIENKLKSKYVFINRDCILSSINRIKSNLNIVSTLNNGLKNYGVNGLIVGPRKKITYNPNEYFDFVLISDLHISELNEGIRLKLYEVYNYCIKNNINNIFNLGDLFEFQNVLESNDKYNNYKTNMNLIENIIKKFPEDPSIMQGILGGNHDARGLKDGYDVIKYLTDYRDDFINLGYFDSIIEFDNKVNKEFIILHHSGIPDSDNNYDKSTQILERLHNKAKYTDSSINDVSFDFFGHLHSARIDLSDNYCIVPSLTKDNKGDPGVWHVKVHFASDGKIDDMLFTLLVFNNGLKKSVEVPYKKLKRN